MKQEFEKPWITIFPDYPRAFAWKSNPCDDADLDSHVGSLFAEVLDGKVEFDGEYLSDELTQRINHWFDEWWKIEDRLMICDGDSFDSALKDGEAVDAEGIEIARELKKLYGDAYRFRYSYAWRCEDNDWVCV